MRMRRLIVLTLTLLSATPLLRAAEREWQTGAWAPAMVTARVGTPYRNYAIETDKVRFDVQETIARGSQAIPSGAGTPVTFAVEEDMVYVKQGAAERPLRLIKRSEKLKTYGAPGGGHSIKTIADQGLTVTLEDGSVWEVDPRGQFKSSQWQALQGVSVRSISENSGFNYEIGNTDVDEAVLARLTR